MSGTQVTSRVAGVDVPHVGGRLFIDETGVQQRRGRRSSGLGRELGWPGIESATEEKTVTITL